MSKLLNVCLFIALILLFSSGVSSKLKGACGYNGEKCCKRSDNGVTFCRVQNLACNASGKCTNKGN